MARATGVDLDELAALEAERSFLLRSLRDLDAEYAVGDVDDADYATLRDGYTKRAADVLRQIDAGKAALPARRRPRWGRRLIGLGIAVAAAVGIGWIVADSSGQDLTDQDVAVQPVAERTDVNTLLIEARALLSAGAYSDAAERYQRVIQLEADSVEALTYYSWLLFIGSAGAGDDVREAAATAARQTLERAAELDDSYADPHCFLAVIAENQFGDADTARSEGERCLALDPPGEIEGMVEDFIADLEPTPDSTPPSTA